MKITLMASAALALGLSASLAEVPAPSRSSLAPVGELTVSRSYVRTGVRPMLQWKIQYPKTITDLVETGANKRIAQCNHRRRDRCAMGTPPFACLRPGETEASNRSVSELHLAWFEASPR